MICNYPECNCPFDMSENNKCLRNLSTIDDFTKNTITKKTSSGFEIKCRKGLYSVIAPTLDQAQMEAKHYFAQYFSDGEYET